MDSSCNFGFRKPTPQISCWTGPPKKSVAVWHHVGDGANYEIHECRINVLSAQPAARRAIKEKEERQWWVARSCGRVSIDLDHS